MKMTVIECKKEIEKRKKETIKCKSNSARKGTIKTRNSLFL